MPNSTTNGRNLNFNSGNVNPLNNNNRSNGFPVRPAQEFTRCLKRPCMDMEIGNLLTDIFRAYYDARKHKRNTKSQLAFEMDLEHNLVVLYEQIRDRTYHPSPGICFVTDHPVKREIFASPFRDRVVHHLLFNYLAPIFEKRMIYDSYSCRKEKGTLKGIERFEHHIRSCSHNYTQTAYVLKLDLRGYFMSIDKRLLYGIIRRALCRSYERSPAVGKCFDRETVDYLIRSILFRDPAEHCRIIGSKSDWDGLPPSKSLLKSPPGVGLPIGDLTSQLFSNIYLNELDQYVKRVLGCRHYGRYVDDFYIIHASRNYLRGLIPQLREFLRVKLHLTLHPDKIVLQHYTKGTPFLGACVHPYRRYPVCRTISLLRKSVRELECECLTAEPTGERLAQMLPTINSYCGYLGHFKAYRMMQKVFGESPLNKYFHFTAGFRKAKIKCQYRVRPLLLPAGMTEKAYDPMNGTVSEPEQRPIEPTETDGARRTAMKSPSGKRLSKPVSVLSAVTEVSRNPLSERRKYRKRKVGRNETGKLFE